MKEISTREQWDISARRWQDKLPTANSLPDMERPTAKLGSEKVSPSQMSDNKLSENVWSYTLWQSYCQQVEAKWRIAEYQTEQELELAKKRVFLDNYEKGKTVAYMEAVVATDEEVRELEREVIKAKSNAKAFGAHAQSYKNMSWIYGNERKHREVGFDPERGPKLDWSEDK